MTPEPRTFSYVVDREDRLVEIGPGWDHFADSNMASGIGSNTILGRPLFSFLTNLETRHIYALLLKKTRETGREIVVPFRCDGPAVRRFMQLKLSPLAGGSVRFETRILREETRESVRLLERGVDRSEALISLCSWCKKVRVDGDWVEVEEAVERLALFDELKLPRISHGCCKSCLSELNRLSDG